MSALTTLFSNIADAIRSKRGTSSSIVASNFPSEIMNIPSSGEYLVLTDQSPTHWDTEVVVGRNYTQANGYGTWTITAPEYSRSGYGISCAFDDLVETQYMSNEHTAGETVTVSQYFPMLIKPSNVFISNYRHGYSSSDVGECYLEFQKQDNSWERLATFTYGGSHTSGNDEKSIDLSTTNWYKGMRLVWNCTNAYGSLGIRRFRITEGYWKEA